MITVLSLAMHGIHIVELRLASLACQNCYVANFMQHLQHRQQGLSQFGLSFGAYICQSRQNPLTIAIDSFCLATMQLHALHRTVITLCRHNLEKIKRNFYQKATFCSCLRDQKRFESQTLRVKKLFVLLLMIYSCNPQVKM